MSMVLHSRERMCGLSDSSSKSQPVFLCIDDTMVSKFGKNNADAFFYKKCYSLM